MAPGRAASGVATLALYVTLLADETGVMAHFTRANQWYEPGASGFVWPQIVGSVGAIARGARPRESGRPRHSAR